MSRPNARGEGPLGPSWKAARGSAPGLRSLLERGDWHPIHRQPGRICYRVETPRGPFFAKHYRPEGGLRAVYLLGLQRVPARAFHRGRALLAKGLATPAPLGLYVRGLLWPREAILVTEWVPGFTPWAVHVRQGAGNPLAAAAAVGALVGQLHRFGYYHGDLSRNVFFGEDGRGMRPFLVDLDGLRRPLTRRRRIKNLEELGRGIRLEDLGLRGRWWALRAYGGVLGLGRAELRRLWREGRAAQIRRMAKKRRAP
ncbi:lipopolysaccharide kinase InaA family protein [Deferrisoma sp.]